MIAALGSISATGRTVTKLMVKRSQMALVSARFFCERRIGRQVSPNAGLDFRGEIMIRRILALCAVAAVITGVSVLVSTSNANATPSGYVAKSALIASDSVTTLDGIQKSGTPISLEQYAAEKAGFTVTVADWSSLTAADFAKYQLLIVGDPDCSDTSTQAVAKASVWSKVVMGKSGLNSLVGNRVLVGTDPEDHYAAGGGNAAPTDPSNPSTAGAEHLVQAGITYAGGVAGATGVYFDTSCDPVDLTSTLNALSATGTGFSQDTSPPCGGNVAQIASASSFASMQDSDIEGWSCSVHVTFPTFPADWQAIAVATDTSTTPTCGTDTTTKAKACGQAYVLAAGIGLTAAAPDLKLSPLTHTDGAGGNHTVTATVTSAGKPAVGVLVTFGVVGQNNGATGTCSPSNCKTTAAGKVTFTYHDGHGIGADTINASASIAGVIEHATATETWIKAVNRAPVANDQTLTTPENTALPITLSGSDPDGNTLTFSVLTQPKHGTLTGTGKNVVYTPSTGFTGGDSFTFQVSDGSLTATGQVGITVGQPPLANTGSKTERNLVFAGGLIAAGMLLTWLGRKPAPQRRRL